MTDRAGPSVVVASASRPEAPPSVVRTVRVVDELDLATVPGLAARLEQELARSPQTLAVDLSHCPFAGVDALELLAEVTAAGRRQGTRVVLLGVPRLVRRAIEVLDLRDQLVPDPRSTEGDRRRS